MLFFLHLSWCVVKPLDIRDSSIRGKDRYFDQMHEICIQSTVVTFFQVWWSGGQEKITYMKFLHDSTISTHQKSLKSVDL